MSCCKVAYLAILSWSVLGDQQSQEEVSLTSTDNHLQSALNTTRVVDIQRHLRHTPSASVDRQRPSFPRNSKEQIQAADLFWRADTNPGSINAVANGPDTKPGTPSKKAPTYSLADATGSGDREEILQDQELKSCSFEIVTVDTRPNRDPMKGDIGGFLKNPANFRTVGALTNQAYAERYGHKYLKVEPPEEIGNYADGWNKFFHAQQRLNELKGTSGCTWLLYMDFDAFFHQPDVSIVNFMTSMVHKYQIKKDQSFIVAKQFDGPGVNTGIFMVRADDNGRLVMDTSIRLFNDLPKTGESVRNRWPMEQGGLNSILLSQDERKGEDAEDLASEEYVNHLPRADIDRVRRTTVKLELEEMNSHIGRFIEHVWGGSREDRSLDNLDHRVDPGKAAFAQHMEVPEHFDHLMNQLKANTRKVGFFASSM